MSKKTEEEWKEQLSPEAYWVTRQGGTERPFTGIFNLHKETGIYHCVCCQSPLFHSSSKFDSGCGWPSFDAHIDNKNIIFLKDTSHGMLRTEVQCAQCNAHLGHIFDDGPTESGKRYCINSVSLSFRKITDKETE